MINDWRLETGDCRSQMVRFLAPMGNLQAAIPNLLAHRRQQYSTPRKMGRARDLVPHRTARPGRPQRRYRGRLPRTDGRDRPGAEGGLRKRQHRHPDTPGAGRRQVRPERDVMEVDSGIGSGHRDAPAAGAVEGNAPPVQASRPAGSRPSYDQWSRRYGGRGSTSA